MDDLIAKFAPPHLHTDPRFHAVLACLLGATIGPHPTASASSSAPTTTSLACGRTVGPKTSAPCPT